MTDENKREASGAAGAAGSSSHDDRMTALFVTMVAQQANMALMFLGRIPHPETKEAMVDLETARMFIDQLEMLEVKTRGNLQPQEAAMIKQQLMNVRLAFVDAANNASAETKSSAVRETTPAEKPAGTDPGDAPESPAAPAESESDSRKKFTKKY